jgi:hypothetical protein
MARLRVGGRPRITVIERGARNKTGGSPSRGTGGSQQVRRRPRELMCRHYSSHGCRPPPRASSRPAVIGHSKLTVCTSRDLLILRGQCRTHPSSVCLSWGGPPPPPGSAAPHSPRLQRRPDACHLWGPHIARQVSATWRPAAVVEGGKHLGLQLQQIAHTGADRNRPRASQADHITLRDRAGCGERSPTAVLGGKPSRPHRWPWQQKWLVCAYHVTACSVECRVVAGTCRVARLPAAGGALSHSCCSSPSRGSAWPARQGSRR